METDLIRVLLVEDSPNDAYFIEKMLNKFRSSYNNFKIDHYGLLSEALKHLHNQTPDAILLDLGLPDSYGLEALTLIIELAPAVPIIVLTGLTDERVAIEAVQKGAQDYLIKGQVDPNLLRRSIRYAIERKRTEEARSLLAAIVENSDDAIISETLDGVITSWNRGAEDIYGYTAAEAVGQPISLLIPPAEVDEEQMLMEKIRRGEHVLHYETQKRRRKDGINISVSLSISPIRSKSGAIIGASTIARDITSRKQAEAEREKLILDLQKALENVKTLSGLLPICASCKKIRDDQGYWRQLEAYIHDHSEAEFSHGLCSDCAKKMYAESFGEKKQT